MGFDFDLDLEEKIVKGAIVAVGLITAGAIGTLIYLSSTGKIDTSGSENYSPSSSSYVGGVGITPSGNLGIRLAPGLMMDMSKGTVGPGF